MRTTAAPAIISASPLAWARATLFNSWLNTALTLVRLDPARAEGLLEMPEDLECLEHNHASCPRGQVRIPGGAAFLFADRPANRQRELIGSELFAARIGFDVAAVSVVVMPVFMRDDEDFHRAGDLLDKVDLTGRRRLERNHHIRARHGKRHEDSVPIKDEALVREQQAPCAPF